MASSVRARLVRSVSSCALRSGVDGVDSSTSKSVLESSTVSWYQPRASYRSQRLSTILLSWSRSRWATQCFQAVLTFPTSAVMASSARSLPSPLSSRH